MYRETYIVVYLNWGSKISLCSKKRLLENRILREVNQGRVQYNPKQPPLSICGPQTENIAMRTYTVTASWKCVPQLMSRDQTSSTGFYKSPFNLFLFIARSP